jgi:hypothetical protein
LTAEGWHEIAAFFVAPVSRRLTKVIVIKDFVVSQPAIKGNRAEFYVEYITLGELDPATGRFSNSPVMKVRSGFDLTHSPSTGWQIVGTPPEPHMTVDAANRYVKDMRDRTTDPSIKKNAEQSLTKLGRLLAPQ